MDNIEVSEEYIVEEIKGSILRQSEFYTKSNG